MGVRRINWTGREPHEHQVVAPAENRIWALRDQSDSTKRVGQVTAIAKPMLQMAQSIHAVMEDTNDSDAVRCDPEINVSLNIVAAIVWPDMVTGCGNQG